MRRASLIVAVALLASCRSSRPQPARLDAGSATSAAHDVLCWQPSEGCVWCVGRDSEPPFIEAEQSRPSVCDPKEPDNCVEFCTELAPDCALPWTSVKGCVFDSELAYQRAVFNRDAADRPEVTLTGRVVDDGGRRIEGALIRVWLSWRNRLTQLVDEVSGRDGGFRVRLRSGPWSYSLRISHPGHASDLVEKVSPDRLGPQPRTFRLGPEHVVRGRVVDLETGAPVPGAAVQAVRTAEETLETSEAQTGDDGSFVLGGLEPRRYFLRVSKFGWRSVTLKNPVTAPSTRVTIKLERANVIRGIVRDAEGEAVPNALVVAVLSGGPTPLQYPLLTNANGRFAEDRFGAGTYYVWARRADMLVYPPEKVELARNEEADVVLPLRHKGARVSGEVQAGPGYTLGPETRVLLLRRSPLSFPRPGVAELGSDGKFAISGLLPGRYEISVRDRASRTLRVVAGPREVEVPIEPDSTVALHEPVVVRPQLSE
jgi:hypothetical protein